MKQEEPTGNALSLKEIPMLQDIQRWKELRSQLLAAQSNKTTPKSKVKQKAGMDYVDASFMRSELNRLYPSLWSWVDGGFKITTETLPIWVVSSGTLVIFHPEIGREQRFYAQAAHRIAYKKGMPYSPENIVDLGNDAKSANTDAWKKAVNMLCNIADDVYRNEMDEVWVLTEEEEDIAAIIDKFVLPEVRIRWNNIMANKSNDGKTFYETVQKMVAGGFVDIPHYDATFMEVLKDYLEGKKNDTD